MTDQTPPPANSAIPPCQQAAMAFMQQTFTPEQLAQSQAGKPFIITDAQKQAILSFQNRTATVAAAHAAPTFSGTLDGGAAGTMTYDPTQTVGMTRFDPGGTRSVVQVPQALLDTMMAGPGNPFYSAADATVRGLTNNPRTAGPQGSTGNIQDRLSGLWSQSPMNPVVSPYNLNEVLAVSHGPTNEIGGQIRDSANNIIARVGGQYVAAQDSQMFALQAMEAARQRPGYTQGVEGLDPVKTEQLRQQAEAQHLTSRENYFANVLSQWAENRVEVGSEYHYMGKAANIPVPANPYEFRADLATEFLKGQPMKASESFSPVSGYMSQYLPGGQGLQQHQWDLALNNDNSGRYQAPGQVNYLPAINVLQYLDTHQVSNPYSQLFGGFDYKGTPSSEGLRKQADFVYSPGVWQNVASAFVLSSIERGETTRAPTMASLPKVSDAMTPQASPLVMVKALDGTMQPDTMVPWGNTSAQSGRLRGGGMVAGVATVTGMNPFNYFNDLLTGFENLPKKSGGIASSFVNSVFPMAGLPSILGGFYEFGKSVPQEKVSQTDNFVRSFPVLESVYRGGNVFELKTDYEGVASKIYPVVNPMIAKYQTDVTAYETNLDKFNQNKTASGYSSISAQFAALNTQKAAIDTLVSPVNDAQTKYSQAAASLTGNVNQKGLLTYGAGMWIGDLGTGYQNMIEKPITSVTDRLWLPGHIISGFVETPRIAASIGQSFLIGGETIMRHSADFPGMASAGLAMQMKGMYDLGVKDPARLAGNIAGMYLLGSAVSAVGNRGIGLFRSRGMEYVPIENIGYGSEGRYPINPAQSESALARSFAEGKLYPTPNRMAEGGPVPYLHGENGVPVARLPNARITEPQITLWTALDSSLRSRGVGVGNVYQLHTSAGSEIPGSYGAPIAESYFAKVSGMLPRAIGLDFPFKTSTIYSTVTEGLEAIPENIRSTARGGDYTAVNEYIQARSAAVPAGQGYMPLLKAEYEAVIPDNSLIEVTGRNYYTKLGGFGDSHFMGQRVPIVEQQSIGFTPGNIESGISKLNPGSSYRQLPIINLGYSVGIPSIGALYSPAVWNKNALPTARSTSREASLYDGSSKTFAITEAAYSRLSYATSSLRGSLARSYGMSSDSKTSTPSTTGYTGESYLPAAASLSSLSKLSESSSIKYSPGYSPSYSPAYSPGYSPAYSPKYSPGYFPGHSPGFTPPGTPSLPFPFSFGGSSLPSGFGKKRYGRFHETLLGVNYRGVDVRTGQGAKFPSLKNSRGSAFTIQNIGRATTGTRAPAQKPAPRRNRLPKASMVTNKGVPTGWGEVPEWAAEPKKKGKKRGKR